MDLDASSSSSASPDLPELPSSPLSELSVLSRTPSVSPRTSLAYDIRGIPSPPSSTLCSGTASPSKSSDVEDLSIMVNPNGARPAKRRKLNTKRDRTTRYINLEDAAANTDKEELSASIADLTDALKHKKKIVVIAGAGISVSSGIPDFRSSRGLFASLKNQHKLKASGAQLFDASVYKSDESTTHFHTMVRELAALTESAESSEFHHMLASLAHEGRLLRLYTQNIDCLDTKLEPLETTVPLNEKGPWKKTVQLHGGLGKMVCSKCSEVTNFDASIFNGPEAPLCGTCETLDLVRTSHAGKRSHGIGKMRPRMVLYNEHNPDEQAIANVVRADLRARPDAVIVVGTSLKIPGVKNMVKDMCGVARKRRDGLTVWINLDAEPSSGELKGCWDLVVRGKSDDVASLAGLPRWDQTVDEKLTVVDTETMENSLRNGKFNVEIRRSTPEESASVKAESPQLRAAELESMSKYAEDIKGILTPTASPKVQPRTALPMAKPKLGATPAAAAKPKQSQLLFGTPTARSKVSTPSATELKRKKSKQNTKKVDKKPRATVTDAFRATKVTATANTKLQAKSIQGETPGGLKAALSDMKVDFQLRAPLITRDVQPGKYLEETPYIPSSTSNMQQPTTPPQKGNTLPDAVSPKSVPRGMEHLIQM
ncbi:DHS-like NAD/FAD-binding domain-containing protein [Microdochium trichocladiopsis]|uniref:DHS-like NAD/FAD-binding domain-containing protein n=1 Tax=Microdochium trichocladiopsis TaxID=1682393 RepID=A0A9P8Y3K9_9PEZI|nr:DHS-like NAD/FAD-binding domain-containing protein [Microdochium trichocladiopsis]KAH7026557.1 DHS-like NAD/FAD-binding domain-containing protein [Microdochium trichocladiopsis]